LTPPKAVTHDEINRSIGRLEGQIEAQTKAQSAINKQVQTDLREIVVTQLTVNQEIQADVREIRDVVLSIKTTRRMLALVGTAAAVVGASLSQLIPWLWSGPK
jgi:hypothetical protein